MTYSTNATGMYLYTHVSPAAESYKSAVKYETAAKRRARLAPRRRRRHVAPGRRCGSFAEPPLGDGILGGQSDVFVNAALGS